MTGIDAFEILQPPLVIKIYFGLLSAKFDQTQRPIIFEKSNIRLVIGTIAQTCILVLFTRMYWISLEFYSNLSSILEWLIYTSYFILDVMLVLICIVLSKFYNDTLISVLNKIGDIEQSLKLVGVELDYTELKSNSVRVMFVYIIMNIIHLTTFIYADYTSVGDILVTLYRTFVLILVDYTHIRRATLFCSMVLLTKNILRKLMQRLEVVSSDRTQLSSGISSKGEFVQAISVIYEDVFACFRDFIHTLSLQLLFDFGICFNVFLFEVFNLIVLILKNDLDAKYTTTILFAIGHVLNGVCFTVFYVVVSEQYYHEVSIQLLLNCFF